MVCADRLDIRRGLRSVSVLVHHMPRKDKSLDGKCDYMSGCAESQEICRILSRQRTMRGMTQRQVAAQAKITLRQYQKFESGERNITTCSFLIACRVIEALGMNVSDFYHSINTENLEMPEKQ